MSCTQVHFDVGTLDGYSVSDEVKRVTLTKTVVLHLIHEDPCTAPLQLCIHRVVKCQKGCYFEELLHDFPIDPCNPVLPPGEYELSIKKTFIPLFDGVGVSLDVVMEVVSDEYIQALIANKGSCK